MAKQRKIDVDKSIRVRQAKLKKLSADLTKCQALIDKYQAQLNTAVNREAGKAKKSAQIGNLRKRVSEKRAEAKAIAEVIALHQSKLEVLLAEQDREALSQKVKGLLAESSKALANYKRCEDLKTDFVNLLNEIASERDHILRRFVRLCEIEGVEPLRNAGLDFEQLINKWRTLALTLFDFTPNERIQATTVQRYSLLNELEAVVTGKGKFHRYEVPPTLVQPEVPTHARNMDYEERRKFREIAIGKVQKIQYPTFKIHGAPQGDSRSDY